MSATGVGYEIEVCSNGNHEHITVGASRICHATHCTWVAP